MTDLQCRCNGMFEDDRCGRDATQEDGLCDTCREVGEIVDGDCCEQSTMDQYDFIVLERLRRADLRQRAQRG